MALLEELVIKFDGDSALQCLCAYRGLVEDLIMQLDGNLEEIFYYRWIQGLLWEEIADKTGLSIQRVRKIRSIILNLYAEICVTF